MKSKVLSIAHSMKFMNSQEFYQITGQLSEMQTEEFCTGIVKDIVEAVKESNKRVDKSSEGDKLVSKIK